MRASAKRNSVILFFFILVADQASKFLVKQFIEPRQSLPVIEGIFHITYVGNTGVSFGLLKGNNLLFLAIGVLALFLFAYLFAKNQKYWPQFSMVLAGIAGNVIDRISLGYVLDFFDLRLWPVFNVADSMISIGTVWLILLLIRNKEDLKTR